MPYVEVYERTTKKVDTRMGPDDQARCERIRRGVEINLNHDDYAVRIVDEPTPDPA